MTQSSSSTPDRVRCEHVGFLEIDFTPPVVPRLVIEFSDGLRLLLEDERAIDLAAEFIERFRHHEASVDQGSNRKGPSK